MKSINHNFNYQLTKEYINRKYAHWRKLRSLLFDLDKQRWPGHLIKRIEAELLPLIHSEKYQRARDKFLELDQERIKYRYSLPRCPIVECPKCKAKTNFELLYSKIQVFAVCKNCNAYFRKYDDEGEETQWFNFIENIDTF